MQKNKSGQQQQLKRLPPIRLSQFHAEIIAGGLEWVAANYHIWIDRRQQPFARLELRLTPNKFDPGKFSEDFMRNLLAVAGTIGRIRHVGGRVYDLSPFQIAGLILGVRVLVQRVHHGHRIAPVNNLFVRAKRLVRTIEKHRKRAKRALVRQIGIEVYRVQCREWKNFVRWLRLHFLDCQCLRRRRYHSGSYRRRQVQILFDWTKAELIRRHHKLRSERELRKLVRLALRYVRRGRTGFGVRDLLKSELFAAEHLADFVTARLAKQDRISN